MNKLILAALIAGITQAQSAGSYNETATTELFGMAGMTIAGTDNTAASWEK